MSRYTELCDARAPSLAAAAPAPSIETNTERQYPSRQVRVSKALTIRF
jgi:azurin